VSVRKIIALALILIVLAGAWCLALNGARWGIYEFKPLANQISLGLDLTGGVSVVFEAVDLDNENLTENIDMVMSVLRTRLDSAGFTEATISKQGVGRIRVEIPVDPTNMVEDPAEITEYLIQPAQIKFVDPQNEVLFTGAEIVSVDVGYDPDSPFYSAVYFELSDNAVKILTDVTTKMAEYYKQTGESQTIGILLDDVLISAPEVTEVLNNKDIYIKGNFDYAYATQLKQQIESGAIPIEMATIETRSVSATLGDSALKNALIAGAIALILIFLFMIIYYRLSGLVAAISLAIYLLLMLLCLALIDGIQLTLPGVAGIILSLGMAVDANVIISERFREELAKGKSIRTSVKASFQRAFTSILDSNVTTVIAAVVLILFGSGTIKGFGYTLLIGIILSFFTAVLVTKGLMYLMLGFNIKNIAWFCPKKRLKDAE